MADLFVDDELFRMNPRTVPLEYTPQEGAPVNQILGAVPRYQRLGDENRVAWYVSQYDAEIRFMDDRVGEMLDLLHEVAIFETSGILFTSDHGESLGEHELFFEHGWFAYDSTLRVPLLVKPPGAVSRRVVDAQVSNLDTLPTLLAMAGIPPDPTLPGRDLLDRHLQGGRSLDPSEPHPLLVRNPNNYPRRFEGVRTPAFKFIRETREGGEELYDLAADPAETRNLVEIRPELAARLRSRLEELRDAEGAEREEMRVVEPSGAELELLRELGYVDP
jgi:arylsulfatase A-like enzyme